MYYQTGGGGTITVYRGSPFQRGHGIGTFLKGLFRASLPLLRRGAQAVGKELLHTGANFMQDLDRDVPAGEAFQSRMSEARSNLKRKAVGALLAGNGYKAKKRRRARQSKSTGRKKKTSRKSKSKPRRKKSRKPKRKYRKTKTRKASSRKKRSRKNSGDIFN